jgi:hypothetical protein
MWSCFNSGTVYSAGVFSLISCVSMHFGAECYIVCLLIVFPISGSLLIINDSILLLLLSLLPVLSCTSSIFCFFLLFVCRLLFDISVSLLPFFALHI